MQKITDLRDDKEIGTSFVFAEEWKHSNGKRVVWQKDKKHGNFNVTLLFPPNSKKLISRK